MSPERNSRATALVGSLLLIMFAIEGITLISLNALISVHVFIGVALIAPVLAKLGTTGYRFIRYYRRDPAYVQAGPPKPLLRALGPLVIAATLALLGTGVALITIGSQSHMVRQLHQASAIIWVVLTGLHVLGHLLELPRLLRTRRETRVNDAVPAGRRRRLRPVLVGAVVAVLSVGGGALAVPLAHNFKGGGDGPREHEGAVHQVAPSARTARTRVTGV